MSIDILAIGLAELQASIAEKESELAELREKVRRWAVYSEKLKTMVQNDYYVDDYNAAKHNLFVAEAALRAAVSAKHG